MIRIRNAKDRGHFNFGWLDTYHTFSFGDYYDPSFMGFRSLRVINEDSVHAGRGFPTHSHRDMEIITYILEGALEHRDSMGNGSIIRPGDVQRMTAGTGVSHSEANSSSENSVHLLQIWITPQERGLKPGYEQKFFSDEQKQGSLCLIASADGRDGSVTVHQDVTVYAAVLHSGQVVDHQLAPNRHAWIQVARGSVVLNGENLDQGDGAAISGEFRLTVSGRKRADILLFDLA
ncbi:MAG TPA: pirin family protein [Pyrinomonadaceae bacterium]|nr:pirin family protein [Pyrinomonadaceae bacterium]